MTHRTGLIIRIETDAGMAGYGEAGDNPYPGDFFDLGTAMPEDIMRAGLPDFLAGKPVPENLNEISAILDDIIPDTMPLLRFGLETALCDLSARCQGKPLCDWFGGCRRDSIPVNYLMWRPVGDWEKVRTDLRTGGYRAVKFKVGSEGIAREIECITAGQNQLGVDISIRLDANRAWTYDTAVQILQGLKGIPIEYVEEPLNSADLDALQKLRRETGVAIALDESLIAADDLEARAKVADVFILKPAVLGGFGKTNAIYQTAIENNCRVVLTSAYETEIGSAAILHWAASLAEDLLPCGLDTIRLFASGQDSFRQVENGAIRLPAGAGLGIDHSLWNKL